MPASTDSSAPPRPPKELLIRDIPEEERLVNREREWTEFYRRHEARLAHAWYDFEYDIRSEPIAGHFPDTEEMHLVREYNMCPDAGMLGKLEDSSPWRFDEDSRVQNEARESAGVAG